VISAETTGIKKGMAIEIKINPKESMAVRISQKSPSGSISPRPKIDKV
jgi:hypothetical protein